MGDLDFNSKMAHNSVQSRPKAFWDRLKVSGLNLVSWMPEQSDRPRALDIGCCNLVLPGQQGLGSLFLGMSHILQ